jgi:hypothetical protein
VPPANPSSNSTTEYYFQNSYNSSINNIPSTSGSINDYCPGRHPLNRTQRYFFCNSSNTNSCPNQYQTYSGCPEYSLSYSTINETFFTARPASIDDSTNFADFNNYISGCKFYSYYHLCFFHKYHSELLGQCYSTIILSF